MVIIETWIDGLVLTVKFHKADRTCISSPLGYPATAI
jgi:hypothetical protein